MKGKLVHFDHQDYLVLGVVDGGAFLVGMSLAEKPVTKALTTEDVVPIVVPEEKLKQLIKAWSPEARAASAAARRANKKPQEGGGDAGGGKVSFDENDPRSKDEYAGALDQNGLPPTDYNKEDPAGGMIACTESNWEDAMTGTSTPRMRNVQAHKAVESALEKEGLRPRDEESGYGENNFHLVSRWADETGSSVRVMGVDSATGRVYNGSGKQIGRLNQAHPLGPQLKKQWSVVQPSSGPSGRL